MTNYEDLAALVASMPRIPRREMKCHPSVVTALREEAQWITPHHTPLWNLYDFLACPVYEDPSMYWGAWAVTEDGVVVKEGNLYA